MLEPSIIHLLVIISGLTGLLICIFFKSSFTTYNLYFYNRFSSTFDLIFGTLNLIGFNNFSNTYLTKLYDLMIVYIIINCLSFSLKFTFKSILYIFTFIFITYHYEFYIYFFLIILINYDFFRGRFVYNYHRMTNIIISISLIIQAFIFVLTIQNSIDLFRFTYYLIYLNLIFHFIIRTFLINLKI